MPKKLTERAAWRHIAQELEKEYVNLKREVVHVRFGFCHHIGELESLGRITVAIADRMRAKVDAGFKEREAAGDPLSIYLFPNWNMSKEGDPTANRIVYASLMAVA